MLTVVGNIFVAGTIQVALLVLGLASLLAAYPAALQVLQSVARSTYSTSVDG